VIESKEENPVTYHLRSGDINSRTRVSVVEIDAPNDRLLAAPASTISDVDGVHEMHSLRPENAVRFWIRVSNSTLVVMGESESNVKTVAFELAN